MFCLCISSISTDFELESELDEPEDELVPVVPIPGSAEPPELPELSEELEELEAEPIFEEVLDVLEVSVSLSSTSFLRLPSSSSSASPLDRRTTSSDSSSLILSNSFIN